VSISICLPQAAFTLQGCVLCQYFYKGLVYVVVMCGFFELPEFSQVILGFQVTTNDH